MKKSLVKNKNNQKSLKMIGHFNTVNYIPIIKFDPKEVRITKHVYCFCNIVHDQQLDYFLVLFKLLPFVYQWPMFMKCSLSCSLLDHDMSFIFCSRCCASAWVQVHRADNATRTFGFAQVQRCWESNPALLVDSGRLPAATGRQVRFHYRTCIYKFSQITRV